MKQYLKGLKTILEDGYFTGDRTGVGTQALPGYAYKMKLEMEETPEGGYLIKNFPLLTTKKVFMRGTFEELMWKLRGETNINSLVEKGVHIWTEWPFKKWLEATGEIDKFEWYVDDEKSDYTDEWKRRIKEFEQRIYINDVDPSNATVVEMRALEAHYKVEKQGGFTSLPLEAGNMGLNDRRDFISMFKKSIEDLNKLGRFDLSLLWTKSMDTYLNLPNANSKYK